MNTLYIEVVGSVVLAGLLGIGTGWMLQRARAARRLRRTVAAWEQRCADLMPPEGEDAHSLQEQVRSLDQLLGAETARTRELEAQLGAASTRLEKARGDAIRLNSQQAGVQERLQRFIREKDRELGELTRRLELGASRAAAGSSSVTEPAAQAAPAVVAAGIEIEAYIDRLSDRGERTRQATAPPAPSPAPPGPHPVTARPASPSARAADRPGTGAASPDEIETAPAVAAAPVPAGIVPATSPDRTAEPVTEPATGLFDDEFDDDLDDTLDATAVIDMEIEREVHAARRIEPPEDPLDATTREPLLYDEDTIAFDEDTIAFDEAALARVRERSR